MSYSGSGYDYSTPLAGSYYGDPSYGASYNAGGYAPDPSRSQGYYSQSSSVSYDSRPAGQDSYSGQYGSSYIGGGQGGYGGGQGGYGGGQGGYGGGQRDQYNSQRGNRGQDRSRGRGGSFRGGDRGGFKRKFGDGGEGQYDNKRNRYEDDIPEDNWNEKHPLMQSVFMENAVEDLEQDWFFIICPTGNRRLLVAANDISQTYDNDGKPDMKFNSCLPNGGTEYFSHHKYDDLTILDTIYSPAQQKFYVLDLLHWKHYPYYDTEAEFRFFILKDKYADLKTPQTVSEKNEHAIELLEKTSYSQTNLLSALNAFQQEVEGVMFIKKTAQYLCHDSYDCLWLKLDNMESVLGYPVPESVKFTKTTEEDIRLKSELKQREKLRAEREEAKERQTVELKSRIQDEEEEGY